jgi:hypothetical protein
VKKERLDTVSVHSERSVCSSARSEDGAKLLEGYRCQNIFTKELEWLPANNKQLYGLLACPSCECKLGVFCLDGIKCRSCLTHVTPAYQFFRKNLVPTRVKQLKPPQKLV